MSPSKIILALLAVPAAAAYQTSSKHLSKQAQLPLPPCMVLQSQALRGDTPRELLAVGVRTDGSMAGFPGHHGIDCNDAGLYLSTVCKYCSDVPNDVCDSIKVSAGGSTTGVWNIWWAWKNIESSQPTTGGWCYSW